MKNSFFKVITFIIIFLFAISCGSKKKVVETIENPTAPEPEVVVKVDDYDSEFQKNWVDSVYSQMTLDDKVGQLFMIPAYSNKDEAHANSIDNLVKYYKVGGVIFFQGGPVRQAKLTNRYQALSQIPLFIAIDGEWGLSMRLDSTYRYPWNMTLGAIQNKKLLEKVGVQMAEENKRIGLHFNFAPVLDINTNPKNPIIGNRSFGENKVNVTEKRLL